MQGKTDGLLTHSLAVQSNYFVVPINPALATILTILLEPNLGFRRTVSRWRRRFGHHRHNCCRQGGALLLQDPLDSGGQIANPMETIGHLNSLRRTTGGAVGIDPAPITADDFRTRVQLQPSSQAIGGTVRQ